MFTEYSIANKNVTLYCRSYSSGIPLVMIHGSCVDSDFFGETAAALSKIFCVHIYDRRGHGRSSEPEDNDYSIAAQVADVASVIQNIGEPCYVVAHSAGTVIAMELAVTYPNLVRHLLMHEPPSSLFLSEDHPRLTKLNNIQQLIASGKYIRALNHFLYMMGAQDHRARQNTAEESQRSRKNSSIFIKYEFEQTFYYEPKCEQLKQIPVTIGLGDADREFHPSILTMARLISCEVAYYPGQHNCAFDLPLDFARMTTGIFLLSSQ